MLKNLKSIGLPWGRGLGTLAFNFTDRHVDFHFNRYCAGGTTVRQLVMFVAVYAAGMDKVARRSWYKLQRTGLRFAWVLFKREDAFGTWHLGHHRPPLYQRTDFGYAANDKAGWGNRGMGDRAWQLRRAHPELKPYNVIDWYGRKVEVMSLPAPSFDRCILMVRTTPGDCTTLEEFTLEEYC